MPAEMGNARVQAWLENPQGGVPTLVVSAWRHHAREVEGLAPAR